MVRDKIVLSDLCGWRTSLRVPKPFMNLRTLPFCDSQTVLVLRLCPETVSFHFFVEICGTQLSLSERGDCHMFQNRSYDVTGIEASGGFSSILQSWPPTRDEDV
jgi:hypothetical protein